MDKKINLIAERFKQLVSRRVKIQEMRVFGSRARGAAGPESDLDVLVVVDRADHETERYISDCAWEAGFADDVVVVPIVLSIDAKGFNLFSDDDLKLFEVLARGEFNINGLKNKSLRKQLPSITCSAMTRILKRLHVHGIIRKVGKTYKYYVSKLGKAYHCGIGRPEYVCNPAIGECLMYIQ